MDAPGETVQTRPPGAAEERELVAACIRCGRCVEVCPYKAISLAPWTAWRRYGTPVLTPRDAPCELCMKCGDVCPTRALAPVPKQQAGMGIARVVEADCLAFQGTVCGLCYKRCPLKDDAIQLDGRLRPHITEDACVGCGVCLHVCPADTLAIDLVPTAAGA
jgi:MauM/NapG family ferredoxin protein